MLKALVCIKPCKVLIQDTVMLLKANTTDTILSYTNQNFLQTNKNDIIPSHKGVWAKPRKAMKTETITKTSYKTSRPH